MAERITVSAPGGSYPIFIKPGLLRRQNQLCELLGERGRVVVVTNTTIAPMYGEALVAALPDAALVTVPDGEQYKSLETTAGLYADFVREKLDRGGCVIALGGGVVGDTAGFAAATYLRGVQFVQVPTTLLAMVDSSVGGKVGVDLPQGKNLVGAFKQPDVVLIDTDVLETLPAQEWRCGMAEVIKHGLLADEGLLDPALWHRDRAAELVRRAVQVKVDVVQQDPFEKNIRAHLNLGHTFAHAIEKVTSYRWPHGEAVGIGLLVAARLSQALGLCDAQLAARVESLITEVGLPYRLNGIDPEAICAAMATDKKWHGGHSRFILLRGVGLPLIVEDVPMPTVIEALHQLQ